MVGADFLHNVSFFANMSRSDIEALAELLTARRYRKDEQVFAQNSLGGSLYIVKSGAVAIVLVGSDGGQQTIAEFGPGQAFGEFALLDGLPRSAGAVTLDRSELLILSRPDFFLFLEHHPSVATGLVVLLGRRLRFTMQHLEDEQEARPVLARMADLLIEFCDHYGVVDADGLHLPIRLTQSELAGILGCPRAVASDTLDQFQLQGLITMRGLQMIVHDLDGLRHIVMEQAG